MQGFLQRTLLYPRTIRWLKPRQWAYLPLRRLQRAFPARASVGDPTELRATDGVAATLRKLGPRDNESLFRAGRVLKGVFLFIGHELRLSRIDWNGRYVSHLWNYHLHYFDYALDLAWAHETTRDPRYVDRFVELASSWIDATRKGRGDAWEPYTVSTRAINWLYAIALFGDGLVPPSRARLLNSLNAQLLHLERRIEWHLLGNHLQRNLQALVIGGLLLSGKDAERWLRSALEHFWAQIGEQVLPDGGHAERSPMYHAIALGDLLETTALLIAHGAQVPDAVSARLRNMLGALAVLARPSGELHLFNDAAHGSAPPVAYLKRAGAQVLGAWEPPSSRLLSLPATGYYGFTSSEGDRLVVDCGEPGPPHQLGHAHCDLLSYELDIGGLPFVVDSGVSGYEGDPLREYVRSTRAHNTVTVGERDQHEMWESFRVARRGRVESAVLRETATGCVFLGAYRPYYSKRVRHAREIVCERSVWTITDTVQGADGESVETYIHLHPDVTVELSSTSARARRSTGGVVMDVNFFGVDTLEMIRGQETPAQGWYCPAFGRALAAPCLKAIIRAHAGQRFGYQIRRHV